MATYLLKVYTADPKTGKLLATLSERFASSEEAQDARQSLEGQIENGLSVLIKTPSGKLSLRRDHFSSMEVLEEAGYRAIGGATA